MKSAFFFCRDPGAANQIVAVHAELLSERGRTTVPRLAELASACEFRVYAKPPGDAVWRRSGVEPILWQDLGSDASAERLLDDIDANVVITGTSDIDETADRRIWRAAAKRGIESHVFLDSLSNLAERFVDRDGRRTLPTHVYAPSEDYCAKLANLGFVENAITVCRDFHMERLASAVQPLHAEARRKLRMSWGAAEGESVVLFVSEPRDEMAAAGRSSARSEFDALEGLIGAIRTQGMCVNADRNMQSPIIVVRPHPRDTEGKYAAWEGGRSPKVVVSSNGAPLDAVRAADVVVGLGSRLLNEAELLGCEVRWLEKKIKT